MADGDRRLARIGLGFPTRSCTFSAWKLGRPSGTRMVLPTFPTAEAVGCYRAPLRGWGSFANLFHAGAGEEAAEKVVLAQKSDHRG